MQAVKYLKILSEPLRMRILFLLKQAPLNVGELVAILGQSQSNVSHHIKLLGESGLIEVQKKGNLNLYNAAASPALPDFALPLWNELGKMVSEIPDAAQDYSRLVKTLSEREKKGLPEDWASWREVQADLPHTFEMTYQGMPRAGVALDIGCGDGELLAKLLGSFEQVIGIDISAERIEQARAAGTALLLANAEQLPFVAESADSVFLRMVLQFVPDAGRALGDAIRVLRPGGRISIIDNATEFSAEFFNDLCERNRSMRVARFTTHPHVFLCALEKYGQPA